MTDKEQIMNNDVDVSECEFFLENDKYSCDLSFINKEELCNCDKIDDCYFKQLARKTQECEELKKKLMQKDEIDTFFNTPIEGWSSNACDICESKNNYERLNQECEELKKQLETSEKWRIKTEGLNEKLELKNTSYRKALEEIEECIKNNICKDCKPMLGCLGCAVKDCLDIISKAKGEKNGK